MNDTHKRFLGDLFASPVFWAALALKLAASALLAGPVATQWFAPFAGWMAANWGNPWETFAQMGQLKAFPYPPGMLYLLAVPRWLLSPLLPADPAAVTPGVLLALRLPSLAADLAVYAVLASWFRDRVHVVRWLWWCSPVVFYVGYVHGQLDLIPTGLFVGTLWLLERRRYLPAMLLFGLAASTKNHLWIAFPFLLVYLRPIVGWGRLAGLAAAAAGVWLALTGPYLGSAGFRQMVLAAEEQGRVFTYRFPDVATVEGFPWAPAFYLCPAVLVLVFAKYATYVRHNWDLTMLFLGLVFLSFVVLVPPMPGWFVWSLPFLTYYACRERKAFSAVLWAFAALYLGYFLLGNRSDLFASLALAAPSLAGHATPLAGMDPEAARRLEGLLFTLMQASLLMAGVLLYTRGVRGNEVYSRREKPIMIGMAGDSGAGKDRLSGLLESLFGKDGALRVSGDDYHKWERGHENWQVFTHLDPKANRLHRQLDDAVALRDGRGIVKVHYDHATGRFTRPEAVNPRQHVFMVGLHTLVLEQMRSLMDLKVFVEPDERLRRYWKLRRDTGERGVDKAKVDAALRRREADRRKSVLPQREHADLVVRYFPLRPADLAAAGGAEPALGLELTARNHFNFEALAEQLKTLPGLTVELEWPEGLSHIRMRVQGRASAADLDRVARSVVPGLFDLTGSSARFADGVEGVCQVAFLACLSQSQKYRAIA